MGVVVQFCEDFLKLFAGGAEILDVPLIVGGAAEEESVLRGEHFFRQVCVDKLAVRTNLQFVEQTLADVVQFGQLFAADAVGAAIVFAVLHIPDEPCMDSIGFAPVADLLVIAAHSGHKFVGVSDERLKLLEQGGIFDFKGVGIEVLQCDALAVDGYLGVFEQIHIQTHCDSSLEMVVEHVAEVVGGVQFAGADELVEGEQVTIDPDVCAEAFVMGGTEQEDEVTDVAGVIIGKLG